MCGCMELALTCECEAGYTGQFCDMENTDISVGVVVGVVCGAVLALALTIIVIIVVLVKSRVAASLETQAS